MPNIWIQSSKRLFIHTILNWISLLFVVPVLIEYKMSNAKRINMPEELKSTLYKLKQYIFDYEDIVQYSKILTSNYWDGMDMRTYNVSKEINILGLIYEISEIRIDPKKEVV